LGSESFLFWRRRFAGQARFVFGVFGIGGPHGPTLIGQADESIKEYRQKSPFI
jgi:hypothetical protein